MEAEESHSLPSASRRTRKVDGVIQSESGGLRTRADDDASPGMRAREDEMGCPSSISETGKGEQIPLSSTFCSIQVLNRLDDTQPHWGGQSTLSSPLIPMLISP